MTTSSITPPESTKTVMSRSTQFWRLLVPTSMIVAASAIAITLRSSEPPPVSTYVGQARCTESCHNGPYGDGHSYKGAASFQQTMHQKIHLRPTPETVIIDRLFEKDTTIREHQPKVAIAGRDTLLVRLFKSADRKEYYIQMKFSQGGDSLPPLKVGYTYGGIGWIQRFLVEVNGSLHIAPFQYIMARYRDRTTYTGAFYYLDRDRWWAFDTATGEMKFYKFNSNRFRDQSWEKNCSYCHVNGFDISRRVTNGGADTSWAAIWAGKLEGDSAMIDQNILVGCESCHGPGSEHVASPTRDNIVSPVAFGNTRAGTDLKLDLCGACHTRIRSTKGTYTYPYDETNGRPYLPGTPLKDYIRNWFGDWRRWPDSSSEAHHQVNQDYMRSIEYSQHLFKDGCWSCHTVHYDPDGLPYQLKENYYSMEDGVGCLSCHGSSAVAPVKNMLETETLPGGRVVNRHSKHSLSVSQCVNCHFTKTATIGFAELPQKPYYEFSSHHFKVLSPYGTLLYRNAGFTGMMNSCAESCHRNGRGSRNFADSTPAAPDFGIHDMSHDRWTEGSDLALADTLWRYYQTMYAECMKSSVVEAGLGIGPVDLEVTPNPFKGSSTIRLTLSKQADVAVAIHDVRGAVVTTLTTKRLGAGTHAMDWNGTDDAGTRVPTGIYFVRLMVNGRTIASRQMIVL